MTSADNNPIDDFAPNSFQKAIGRVINDEISKYGLFLSENTQIRIANLILSMPEFKAIAYLIHATGNLGGNTGYDQDKALDEAYLAIPYKVISCRLNDLIKEFSVET